MQKQINIKIDKRTYERLRIRAKKQGDRSISSLIREVLASEIKDETRTKATASNFSNEKPARD